MDHEIVPPEPHSNPNALKVWKHMPRWLQVTLGIMMVLAGIFALYVVR